MTLPTNIQTNLYNWIKDFVEKPNTQLNNFSPCPYAKQAREQNKIKTVLIEDANNSFHIVTENIKWLDEGYDVIIFCIDTDELSVDQTLSLVERLNNFGKEHDLVFLEDHPLSVEIVNKVQMNFGECILILGQKSSKLNEASNKLKLKGYYDVWSLKNLEDVVLWRNK